MRILILIALFTFSDSILAKVKHNPAKSHTADLHQKKVTKDVNEYKIIFKENTKYDKYFKQWSKEYINYANYNLLKAICVIESKLNPYAVSKEGALGIAQFMPKTYQGIRKKIKGLANSSLGAPSDSIKAAAYHLNYLNDYWNKLSYNENKRKLILAGYNSGEGNITKAIKLSGESNNYETIIKNLYKVVGKDNASETINYVNAVSNLL